MRKIISAQQERKKQRRNQLIVGGILIIVMLFSTIGYASRGNTDNGTKKIEYRGYEFVYSNNYWIVEKNGIAFYLQNNPYELEEINSTIKQLGNYIAEPLYLYSEYPEFNSQIAINFNSIASRMQSACPENQTCEGDIPAKICDFNFIIFEETNKSEILQDNNCVYIRGEKQNLNKLTDIFILKILGIEE